MNDEVISIPLDCIRVVNPRYRDKKKFMKVVESIQNVGLKKPIQVRTRDGKFSDMPFYDLICGQGRMEAFKILGYEEIPAIVLQVNREDGMLMSLVENMARRFPRYQDLVSEVLRLKDLGYSNVAIGKKLDVSDGLVGGLLILNSNGEERLIYEALKGTIPLSVAIEIAKVETSEEQRQYLQAYEQGSLNHSAIRTVKRVLSQRHAFGKKLVGCPKKTRTVDGLVNTMKKEGQRQRVLVRKAKVCEARVMFIVEAMRRLLANENFVNLLRAERIDSIPTELETLMNSTRAAL